MGGKIDVLVVDDSAVMRQVLTAVLGQEPDIRVLGAVADPIFAMQRMRKVWPDVIVLDIEMPRMDGLTFLRKIMAERPTPVVICSSLTEKGTDTAIQALTAGAVAAVGKPAGSGGRPPPHEAFTEMLQAIREAGAAGFKSRRSANRNAAPVAETSEPGVKPQRLRRAVASTEGERSLIAIGASTGGTQALHRLLSELPPSCPGIVIVQHMPPKFTASFARRLDESCAISVREACDGDEVLPGLALIAPGGRHMTVSKKGAGVQVRVLDGPPVNRHRPSVDVLFRSVACEIGDKAIGIILTGMGNDGAAGLKHMHACGAYTVAQDESSSVVYGMPREAVKLGAVDESLPLSQMAAAILEHIHSRV